MTLAVLVRFTLRRHRLAFGLLLFALLLHDLGLLYLFQFWKEQFELTDLLLRLAPGPVREGLGIPLTSLREPATYKALLFLRPDHRMLTLAFGVIVGTDAIAGEVGRGTSDLLFSHPVRRAHAVAAAAVATLLHLLCAGVVMLGGFALLTRIPGLSMGPGEPALAQIVPAVGNVLLASFAIFCTVLLAGSLCRSRGGAVGWGLLLVFGPLLLNFMGIFQSGFAHVASVFPEHYYRPHVLLVGAPGASFGECAVVLVLLSAVALAGAFLFAARRDL